MSAQCFIPTCGVPLTRENTHESYSHESGLCRKCQLALLEDEYTWALQNGVLAEALAAQDALNAYRVKHFPAGA